MASGNILPLLKGEKSLSEEMEIVFNYRAVALWKDEMSNDTHEEIHRLSSCFNEKNPRAFTVRGQSL